VARMGEERKVYKVLVGKSEGKRPPGRPRRRWEDGIRMDLREIGLGGCGLDSTGHSSLMIEAVRTSETSVDNHFTRQYIPEDNSEHHTRRRENLKSHNMIVVNSQN
jgi:hypothetical protein